MSTEPTSSQPSAAQDLPADGTTPVQTAGGVIVEPNDLRRHAVNWRSVGLGLLGVFFICGLTPYNDYVLGNTFLVGNFLPIGLLLFFMVIIVAVNAPLFRWAPRFALRGHELAVTLGMVLVASTLPSSGLMRYLPAGLVGLHNAAVLNANRHDVLRELNLPTWLFPDMRGEQLRDRANDPVIRYFYTRDPDVSGSEGLLARMAEVPWGAWITPMLTWGSLIVAIYGAVLCLMIIVRRQWAENERLAFPLATVYSELIESPRPGRAFNETFRGWGFWIAFILVFVIHSSNALFRYNPLRFPEIPIGFNFGTLFADEPWRYTDWYFKASVLYFSIIGFTYFLQSNVAFSLWFLVILNQVLKMQLGMAQVEMTRGMQNDMTFGAVVVFAGVILWVGRHHWLVVLKQMVRGARDGEAVGRYLPYSAAGWGLVVCFVGMVSWLVTAGATVGGSIVVCLMLLTLFLVIARVVAETGLIFVQIDVPATRPMLYAMTEPLAMRPRLQDAFWASTIYRFFSHDMREALAPYAINALRVADLRAYNNTRRWTQAVPFVLAIVLALGVGYVIAGASMLYVEYAYDSTLDISGGSPLNGYGVDATPNEILDRTNEFRGTGTGPRENHSRLTFFGVGATITGALSALRLRFVGWPLHPVGFLLLFSYPMGRIWFSVFVGWAAKMLLVKYGGSDLYRKARPYFIGMIVGEAAVAATWLVVSLVRNERGLPYEAINLLPT